MAKSGSTSFGANIKVDGEKEFKKALENANAALRVNSSELKKVSAQYADNTHSMEALTAKHDVLDRSILSQKEKVEILQRALEAAGRNYGEMDSRTINYQTSLNRAEAELARMNQQLKQNDEELERAKSGQTALKEELQQTEASLKMHQSALAAVDSQYKENADSSEALEARGQALRDIIEDQEAKLENLQRQLELSRQATGENSEETMALQEAYNRASVELSNMNEQLSSNEESVQKAESNFTSLEDVIMGIANASGIEVPGALSGMMEKFGEVSASGAALVGVLGGIVTALGKATFETTAAVGEIDELTHKTGLSAKTIQELTYASEYLEISANDIGNSIAKMTKNMDSARSGTGAAAEAFKKLKVSVVDGHKHLKDSEETFYRVIDALANVKNETEQDALAMTIFGKSAKELKTVIMEGSEGIKEYARQANEMGYVIEEQQIEKFLQLDDAMVKLTKVGETLRNKFAEALLPILTSLFEALGKIPVPIMELTIQLVGVVGSIALLIKMGSGLKVVANGVTAFINAFAALSPTTLKVLALVAALVLLVGIIAVMSGKTTEIERTFNSIGDAADKMQGRVQGVQNAYQSLPPYVKGNDIPHYAAGTQYHPGGFALTGEHGPEIAELPAGTRVRTAAETRRILAGSGDTYIYNITIPAKDVKEFNDIVRIAEAQRRRNVRNGY